jgi:hypothetical protein
MRTEIIVTVNIPGFHYWDGASATVNFLSDLHYHNFSIVTYKEVTCLDREIEYFEFAEKIKEFIHKQFPMNESSVVRAVNFGTMSCEMIAQVLVEGMHLSACEVWEDQYFGSKVYA